MDLSDSFFGVIGVKNGLLTRRQVTECLMLQETEGYRNKTLGEICRLKNYLTEDQIQSILRAQAKSEILLEDILWGKIAIRNKLVTKKQIDKALAIQKDRHYSTRIGEILVENGYLTPQQVQAVLKTQMRLKKSGRLKKIAEETMIAEAEEKPEGKTEAKRRPKSKGKGKEKARKKAAKRASARKKKKKK